MELTCPKCQGATRSYERNGVTLDQCSECRGIFLDRGELERLVDAENAWNQSSSPQQPQPSYREPSRDRSGHGEHGGGYGKHPKKKRGSFLEEMFD